MNFTEWWQKDVVYPTPQTLAREAYKAALNRAGDLISTIPAECACGVSDNIDHRSDCRWKALYDAEQLVRKEIDNI